MTEVVVYLRPGCHLCDDAIELLNGLVAEGYRFDLVSVNIESDSRLHATFLERIPVIEVDGNQVSELVPNLDTLRRSLDTLST